MKRTPPKKKKRPNKRRNLDAPITFLSAKDALIIGMGASIIMHFYGAKPADAIKIGSELALSLLDIADPIPQWDVLSNVPSFNKGDHKDEKRGSETLPEPRT